MWSIFALLTLSTVQSQNWLSGGDQTIKSQIESRPVSLTRSTDSAAIRVAYVTSSLTNPLKAAVDDVIPNVNNYLTHTLKVLSVIDPLDLGDFTCAGKDYKGLQFFEIDFYVLFEVNTDNTPADGVTTGKSYTCHIENSAKSNPLGGVIKLNSAKFVALDKYRRWTYVLHEVIHLLGFSEVLSQKWEYLAYNRKYTAAELTVTASVRGVTSKRFLKTPKVLEKARSAFNNPNLIGVELEEQGYYYNNINANNVSHWDARVMFNDIMVIRSISEMIISTVTLAALEDSGWYTVAYTSGQDPIVGRGNGCTFTDEKCIISKHSNNKLIWCSIGLSSACDTFNLNKGTCIFNNNCVLTQSAFNYFSAGNIGGNDIYADFCPYVEALSTGNCRKAQTSTNSEIFGSSSRCFEHTLLLEASGTRANSQIGSCFEVLCGTSGDFQVRFNNLARNGYETFTCPAAGGLVQFNDYKGGWVRCPPRSTVCGDAPCLNVCLGNGICDNGMCQCFPGYSGPDCSLVCETGCITCKFNETTKALQCTNCKPGLILREDHCISCSSHCTDCNWSEGCIVCEDKYKKVLDANGKYICKPICAPGCPDCEVPDGCIIPDGKCLDSDRVLQNCCGSCAVCNIFKCCECLQCKTGYFLTSINTCTKDCAANCKICATIYNCATCQPGYLLNADYKCMRCPVGCATCDDSCPATCVDGTNTLTCSQDDCYATCPTCSTTVCTACSAGYSMNVATNECIRNCPQNCKSCSSQTVCTVCNGGFYLNPLNQCSPCESGCINCVAGQTSDYTICLQCYCGYYKGLYNLQHPDDVDCVRCQPGCYSCDNFETCKACGDRWYLDVEYATYDCIQCQYGCKRCDDSEICKVADCGFYILPNGRVNRCNKACSTCDADQVCNTCVSGYFFYNCTSDNCLCRYCEPNCARCSGPIECVVCRCGYYLAGVNECRACMSSCYNCDRPTNCNSCRGAYYLDSNFQCQPCGAGCTQCTDANHCRCCSAGWWPDEFVCKLCPNKCSLCWTNLDCYACVTGWWLYQCKHDCETVVPTCKQCPSTCVKCVRDTSCLLCKSGYFVLDGICTPCGPNCANCLNANHCNICKGGWYVLPDRTCAKCAAGCADCCDEWTCLRANGGYFLQNSDIAAGTPGAPANLVQVSAVQCSSQCNKCTAIGSCTCCNNGYYLDAGYCSKCPASCTLCSNPGQCTRCISRYYLSGGSCLECDTNCNACDTTGCLTPKSGYYCQYSQEKNKKVPLVCQSPCNTCVGTGEFDCLTCRNGFGTVSNPDPSAKTYKCSACQQGCSTCTTSTFCKTAASGYYLWPDGTVYSCSLNCISCAADVSQGTSVPLSYCKTCKTGFGVNNGVCQKCPDFCSKCSNGKCDVSNGGYYVTAAGLCSKCTSPCTTCSGSANACTACINGYYLSGEALLPCHECVINCNVCVNGNSCKTCKAGTVFVDSATNPGCVTCMTGCSACASPDSCTTAKTGYYLDISGNPVVSRTCASAKGNYCKTCAMTLVETTYVVKCLTCTTSSKVPPNCA